MSRAHAWGVRGFVSAWLGWATVGCGGAPTDQGVDDGTTIPDPTMGAAGASSGSGMMMAAGGAPGGGGGVTAGDSGVSSTPPKNVATRTGASTYAVFEQDFAAPGSGY